MGTGRPNAGNGVFLHPDEVVLVGQPAIRPDLPILHGVQRTVVASPAHRQIGKDFECILAVRERIAANPRLAVLRDNVAILVEPGLSLVLECRLQVLVRIHPRHVVGRGDNLDAPPHLLDLFVRDRVDQVLDHVHVLGGDRVAGLDLAFGVGVDSQQFFGISLPDIGRVSDQGPERSQNAGCQDAPGSLLGGYAAAVVEVEFTDMHDVSLFNSLKSRCVALPSRPVAQPECAGSGSRIDSESTEMSASRNFGLNRYTSSGTKIRASTMLINITATSSRPISERNFSSDRKYHGARPMVIRLAVKKIALPQVVRETRIA